MDSETIAALERAAEMLKAADWSEDMRADATLIRTLIERERNGEERAQIVAWLRDDEATAQIAAFVASDDPDSVQRGLKLAAHLASMPGFDFRAADRSALAFGEGDAAGAHKPQIITGQSEESEHVAED